MIGNYYSVFSNISVPSSREFSKFAQAVVKVSIVDVNRYIRNSSYRIKPKFIVKHTIVIF